MKIQLLLTGNEIMTGDTVDTNSCMVADFLGAHGWRVARKVTVGDELPQLKAEIAAMAAQSDVLIVNGGLGPTVDDLTAQALAEVSGRPLAVNPAAMNHVETWCGQRGIAINDANRKQALLPRGADIIANAIGSAVGIRLQIGQCLVLATPGVPGELRAMMKHEILPLLLQRFPMDHIRTRRLAVFGLGESSLQQRISQQFPEWPANLELGFRASLPLLEIKLTARREADGQLLDEWEQKIRDMVGDSLIGDAPITLAQSAVAALDAAQLRVTTAESCTGGLIAAQLTTVPGASNVFEGGFVSYSNAMKEAMLDVDSAALERFGAVSREVAEQMLAGALRRTGADLGVAVTGIAGPGGGSEEKPVGTVWLAWGRDAGEGERIKSQCLRVPFGRDMFQQWVAAAALDLIRRLALDLNDEPHYLERYARAAPDRGASAL